MTRMPLEGDLPVDRKGLPGAWYFNRAALRLTAQGAGRTCDLLAMSGMDTAGTHVLFSTS